MKRLLGWKKQANLFENVLLIITELIHRDSNSSTRRLETTMNEQQNNIGPNLEMTISWQTHLSFGEDVYKPASDNCKTRHLDLCVTACFPFKCNIPLTMFPPFGHIHPSHSPTQLFSNQERSSKTVVWLPRQRVDISSVGTAWLYVCLMPPCKVHRLSLQNENRLFSFEVELL